MRHGEDLRERYRRIAWHSAPVLWIAAALAATPLVALPFFPGDAHLAAGFVLPALGLALAGAALRHGAGRGGREGLTWQEGTVVVVLTWGLSLVGFAGVFMLVSEVPPTLALFEATSGLTTTGLSILDVAGAPPTVLLYRSVLQLAGGAGLAIIMLSALTGPSGMGLSSAEGRTDPVAPHVRQSARVVVVLYGGYFLGGSILLRLAGLDWFDAVNHAMTAVSTGGFSTRPESIGAFDSPAVEAVAMALMLLGALNFLTSWTLVRGHLGAFARNGEVRLTALLVPLGALAVLAGLFGTTFTALDRAVRVAVFEVVSALTTTGFQTTQYQAWPAVPVLTLVLLMIVGGGIGSTAGGIKQYRTWVLLKSVGWEVRRILLPPSAVVTRTAWVGEQRRVVGDAEVREYGVFAVVYFVTLALGSGLIAACGYGLRDSVFEFTSALSTVGLSIGVTAPSAPTPVLWALTAGMFLGRLEFFAVVAGLARVGGDALAWMEGLVRAQRTRAAASRRSSAPATRSVSDSTSG